MLAVVVLILCLIWLGYDQKFGGNQLGLFTDQRDSSSQSVTKVRVSPQARKTQRRIAVSTISKLTLKGDESGMIYLPPSSMKEIRRRLEASDPELLEYMGGTGMVGGVHSIPKFMGLLGDLKAETAWISDGDELHSTHSGLDAKVAILGDDGEMVEVEITIGNQGHKWISSSMSMRRGNGMIWWSGDPDDDGILLVLGSNSEMKDGPKDLRRE